MGFLPRNLRATRRAGRCYIIGEHDRESTLLWRPLDAAFGDGREAPAAERDPPYLQGLNKEQREAVLAVEGPVLVLKLDRAD
jgi:hypothetical protein